MARIIATATSTLIATSGIPNLKTFEFVRIFAEETGERFVPLIEQSHALTENCPSNETRYYRLSQLHCL